MLRVALCCNKHGLLRRFLSQGVIDGVTLLEVFSLHFCVYYCVDAFMILKINGFNFYIVSTKVYYEWYQSSFLGKKVEEFFLFVDFHGKKRRLRHLDPFL
jgi:hypothetical protein